MEPSAVYLDLKIHTVGGNPSKRATTKQNGFQEFRLLFKSVFSRCLNYQPRDRKTSAEVLMRILSFIIEKIKPLQIKNVYVSTVDGNITTLRRFQITKLQKRLS